MFRSVLVANRGEIAVRIIRAARERGLRTIAVYSEADRAAAHVLAADEAYLIGPPAPSESYLRIDRLLEIAKRSGAEAIHPGYGFLAERAEFAKAVEEAGIVFIGPTAETISAMGDKTEARRRMAAAGVPIVPGATEPIRTAEEAVQVAQEVGLPALIKAAAGGGGRGMRVVQKVEEVPQAFEAAGREALAAFGDGSVYIERYLGRPRHIEVQVLGDGRGHVIHVGERECSVQRRHQKLIEEAPAPTLTSAERAAMGEAAVKAAASVQYRGAGTIEFLYQDGEFFFLEMNTRIQVEHPVTELVWGVDLVDWQLRIAAGEELTLRQDDLVLRGHSIECRITCEDTANGFLPSSGVIDHLVVPGGQGVRWDAGVLEGSTVSTFYDSLLGKLIVYGRDRGEALRRMARALDELVISGVDTTISFHRRVMDEPHFREGDLSIRYLEEHPEVMERQVEEAEIRAAAVAAALLEEEARSKVVAGPRAETTTSTAPSAWQTTVWPWRG